MTDINSLMDCDLSSVIFHKLAWLHVNCVSSNTSNTRQSEQHKYIGLNIHRKKCTEPGLGFLLNRKTKGLRNAKKQ